MTTATLESLEQELEIAAESLEAYPYAEAESTPTQPWRWIEVLVSTNGQPWETKYKLGPIQLGRETAIYQRGDLWQKWHRGLQRNQQLLVRCLTWVPDWKKWVDCNSHRS